MKFRNGREIKENDPVIGLDYAGRLFKGTALAGDRAKGHRDFIVRHETWKTVSPDLNLAYFLHAEDAKDVTDENSFRAALIAAEKQSSAPATAGTE